MFTNTNEQKEWLNFLILKYKEAHILLTLCALRLALWSLLHTYCLIYFSHYHTQYTNDKRQVQKLV